ncbi:hypothetical protein BJY04DRAFT_192618 [Aspergillus karnatakaensis]|uniref:uncharacterized protein n=1 Tax=Aspergillus karnatakaensis TaxID=1810916 RepID=UPI003CCCFD44
MRPFAVRCRPPSTLINVATPVEQHMHSTEKLWKYALVILFAVFQGLLTWLFPTALSLIPLLLVLAYSTLNLSPAELVMACNGIQLWRA